MGDIFNSGDIFFYISFHDRNLHCLSEDFTLASHFNAAIASGVIYDEYGHICTAVAISVFSYSHSQLNFHPGAEYGMMSGAAGCFNADPLGTISPLKFNGHVASSFGPLTPVPVIVFCT